MIQSLDFSLINKNYLIICEKNNGLGDLSCGFKIANDLHERLSVPIANIIIATNDPLGSSLFNKHEFTVLDFREIKSEQITKTYDISLQIIAPTDQYSCHAKVDSQIPALALMEYGFDTGDSSNELVCESLGLDKPAMGFMVENSLKEWGFSDQSNTSILRLQQLKDINKGLQQAILGRNNEDTEDAIIKFDEKSRLYTSYAPSSKLNSFVAKIVAESVQEVSKFVFVFSDFRFDDAQTLAKKCHGISAIKIVELDKVTETYKIQKLSIDSGKGRKIKIITCSLKHAEMLTLFKAVERKVLVTGDQSLSEAISGNMNLIYVAPLHKLTLKDQLQKLGYPTVEEQTPTLPNFLSEFTSLNKKTVVNNDYFPQFSQLIKERLQNFSPPIALKHFKDDEFYSAIQPNTKYLISFEQLCSLKIQVKDSQSLLPRFLNSYFRHQKIGDSYIIENVPLKK
jgi:hypothetical protein